MTDSRDEVQKLWKEQPGEAHEMRLEDIREKARRFEAKRRRRETFTAVFVGLLVIGVIVEVFWPNQNSVERTGDSLTLLAFGYVAYQYRKDKRLLSRSDGPGVASSVEFYRAVLVWERNLAGRSRQYLLPFVPGVALSLMSGIADKPVQVGRLTVIAGAGVLLFVSIAWWNASSARKLQRDIDAIDAWS